MIKDKESIIGTEVIGWHKDYIVFRRDYFDDDVFIEYPNCKHSHCSEEKILGWGCHFIVYSKKTEKASSFYINAKNLNKNKDLDKELLNEALEVLKIKV